MAAASQVRLGRILNGGRRKKGGSGSREGDGGGDESSLGASIRRPLSQQLSMAGEERAGLGGGERGEERLPLLGSPVAAAQRRRRSETAARDLAELTAHGAEDHEVHTTVQHRQHLEQVGHAVVVARYEAWTWKWAQFAVI